MESCCQKPGILKIVYIVSQSIAIGAHIFALVAPRWDNWQPVPIVPGTKIDLHQNLWSIVDDSSAGYANSLLIRPLQEEWKKRIVKLMLSAMGVAVVAEILLVVMATVKICTKNKIIHIVLLTIVCLCSATTAGEVIYAAQEFKRNHKQIVSEIVLTFTEKLQKYALDNGYYVCLVSGSMYCLAALAMVSDIVKTIVMRKKDEVVPILIQPAPQAWVEK